MGRRQGPKVNAYLLFMQEQRYIVRGWANKSGAELQKLCDPLWKALSKEEKAALNGVSNLDTSDNYG